MDGRVKPGHDDAVGFKANSLIVIAERSANVSGFDLRAQAIRETAEFFHLIGFEFALLVAADENLEHDPAVDVEEQDRRRKLVHERAFDESNARATLVAQVAVKALAAGNVVIAARRLRRRAPGRRTP